MTEDPYRLDDDLHISSMDSHLDDEYDGLETDFEDAPKRRVKKMPIVLAMMLVVFVSGAAYIAYQMFVVDVGPLVPAQPPMAIAQQQQPQPSLSDDSMPPQVSPDFDPMMPPVAQDAQPMADENAALPPVADESGTYAEGLLPPGQDVSQDVPPTENMDPAVAQNDPMQNPADVAAVEPVMDPAAPQDAALPPVAEDVSAMPPAEEVAGLPPVAEEVAAAVPPAPVEPVVAEVPAAPEAVQPAAKAAAVAKAPSEELLQPIDPVPAAAPKAAQIAEKASATAKRTARTADAKLDEVQKILESAGVTAAPAQPAPPVEVTPRAREVIVVTRSYNAQSPQAMIAAGDRVLAADQFGAAAEIYDNQLRHNPSDPLALAGKALALQKDGDHVGAMNAYERLLSLNPRDVEALTNYLGLLQEQDPQQAMVRLQNLSEQYPQNAAVAGQLGMLHARMMDTPNAIRHFQKAAALDSTNATYPFNLAVLYDRLGTVTKARAEYRKALGLARDYPSRSSVSADVIRHRLNSIRN